MLIAAINIIMKSRLLPGEMKLLPRAVPLLALAAFCAVSACADEEATVQQTEMQQQPSETEGQRPPEREGPDGCYLPEQQKCDCEIVEVDCTEDVGIWTTGCASCAMP